jgi:hypothetical protein
MAQQNGSMENADSSINTGQQHITHQLFRPLNSPLQGIDKAWPLEHTEFDLWNLPN